MIDGRGRVFMHAYYSSPVGVLLLEWDGEALVRLAFPSRDGSPRAAGPGSVHDVTALQEPLGRMEAYFAGELRDFGLPLRPEGTEFQRLVWRGLLEIPYGATMSYAELARRIGRPGAARAVGAANGRNPIAIIAPCHRVIGANGSLTGFGGGLDRKEWLLDHEREVLRARGEWADQSLTARGPMVRV